MGVCNRLKPKADPVVTTATSMIVHTRRRSVCRISCGEYMLPLLGVVSSVNISDRFHLGVESKTFLRYLSVLLSRTLPHSSTQSLRKRDPSPFFDPDISQRYCRMLWVRLRDLRRAAHLGWQNHALESLPVAGLVHPPLVVYGSFDFHSPRFTEYQSLRGAGVCRDVNPTTLLQCSGSASRLNGAL